MFCVYRNIYNAKQTKKPKCPSSSLNYSTSLQLNKASYKKKDIFKCFKNF